MRRFVTFGLLVAAWAATLPAKAQQTVVRHAGPDGPTPEEGQQVIVRRSPPPAERQGDHADVAMTLTAGIPTITAMVNGKGPFLYDSPRPAPDAPNVAERHPDVVARLFDIGKADAAGGFPEYLLLQAESAEDAPGCSPFAAIR